MNYKIVEKQIIKCIESGRKEFVIYPYGNNGVMIKQYMLEHFGVEPVMIIDNQYCKYNSKIQDKKYLKNHFTEKMVIILSVDDSSLNSELLEELLDYVQPEQIINVLDSSLKSKNDLSKFRIQNFLPDFGATKRKNILSKDKKIKVRVLSSSKSTWNSLYSICKAMQEDPLFELRIIIASIDKSEAHKRSILKSNFEIVESEEYDAMEDKPDVLIVSHPYDRQTELKGICDQCKMVVVTSMQLIRYKKTLEEFWSLQQSGFARFRPDYYLFDSLIYKEISESPYMSDKIIEIGNAKYDGIYNAMKDKKYGENWDKLRNKKVILWATDHGIYNGQISYEQTFDLYAEEIFDYFKKHKEVGLIFRPHPTFIKEMLENNLWTESEINNLALYFEKSDNMVFDLSENYNQAFSLADGIITDAYCGIICSALATKKPLCMAYRSVELEPLHRELAEVFYSAYSSDDIVDFIEMVKKEEDDLFPLREKAFNAYIKNFDGKNGYRIKEFIKSKFRFG